MKKDYKVGPILFPMPILMIATYDEKENIDVMPMAWGGICSDTEVALNLDATHKTTANLKLKKAFTISIADVKHLTEVDYLGIISENKEEKKFEKTKLHAIQSSHVDAPIIEEFPLTMECEVTQIEDRGDMVHFVGKIKNVLVEDSLLNERGQVEPSKLNALIYDPYQEDYYVVGEKVGQAYRDGLKIARNK